MMLGICSYLFNDEKVEVCTRTRLLLSLRFIFCWCKLCHSKIIGGVVGGGGGGGGSVLSHLCILFHKIVHFVKSVEATSLKLSTMLKLVTLHLEQMIAQVKYANYSNAHVQSFVLLNGEMATVSTCS